MHSTHVPRTNIRSSSKLIWNIDISRKIGIYVNLKQFPSSISSVYTVYKWINVLQMQNVILYQNFGLIVSIHKLIRTLKFVLKWNHINLLSLTLHADDVRKCKIGFSLSRQIGVSRSKLTYLPVFRDSNWNYMEWLGFGPINISARNKRARCLPWCSSFVWEWHIYLRVRRMRSLTTQISQVHFVKNRILLSSDTMARFQSKIPWSQNWRMRSVKYQICYCKCVQRPSAVIKLRGAQWRRSETSALFICWF